MDRNALDNMTAELLVELRERTPLAPARPIETVLLPFA
jgi:hypothetical protein